MTAARVRPDLEETAALWQGYGADRCAATRNRLMEQYFPLVKYVLRVSRITPTTLTDYDDLVSEGVLGLAQALERFNPQAGVKFETYAIPRIRGAMLDALNKLDSVSRRVRAARREVAAAREQLEQDLARTPTSREIAATAGLSLRQSRDPLIATGGTTVSLDASRETEIGTVPRVEPAADLPDLAEALARREAITQVAATVRELPRREQHVLGLYYRHELTQREVARVMGCSESRVCQLLRQARQRVRRGLQERGVLSA